MQEVYRRLDEKAAKFMDESSKELPLPDKHWGETPLFERRPDCGR
jgi:hypothetical protein